MARVNVRTALLLQALDESFEGRSWNGTTLRGALRGVSPALAMWRPGPGRPRIWDYVLHCAYWIHTVRRRVAGGPVEDFPRGPANFPAPPREATDAAWRADVKLLVAEFKALRALVERMPPGRLDRRSAAGRWTILAEIRGVAAHNCYHTGQIRLVLKLAPSEVSRS